MAQSVADVQERKLQVEPRRPVGRYRPCKTGIADQTGGGEVPHPGDDVVASREGARARQ